jgi:hypothetical protein
MPSASPSNPGTGRPKRRGGKTQTVKPKKNSASLSRRVAALPKFTKLGDSRTKSGKAVALSGQLGTL